MSEKRHTPHTNGALRQETAERFEQLQYSHELRKLAIHAITSAHWAPTTPAASSKKVYYALDDANGGLAQTLQALGYAENGLSDAGEKSYRVQHEGFMQGLSGAGQAHYVTISEATKEALDAFCGQDITAKPGPLIVTSSIGKSMLEAAARQA